MIVSKSSIHLFHLLEKQFWKKQLLVSKILMKIYVKVYNFGEFSFLRGCFSVSKFSAVSLLGELVDDYAIKVIQVILFYLHFGNIVKTLT